MALERLGRRLELVFEDELTDAFGELGSLVADAFSDRVSADMLDTGPAIAADLNGHSKAPDEIIVEQVAGAAGLDAWVAGRMRDRFRVHYARTADETLATVNAVLELGVELPDEMQRAIIHEGGRRLGLLDVGADTKRAIFRAIADGREAGEGPLEIARRIRSEVPAGRFRNAGPAYRARLIARTETKWAQNRSSMAAYRAADNVDMVVAFDARLGATDSDCEMRDGRTFSFDEAEAEMAREHPNGTLSFAPVVAETVSQLEGAR